MTCLSFPLLIPGTLTHSCALGRSGKIGRYCISWERLCIQRKPCGPVINHFSSHPLDPTYLPSSFHPLPGTKEGKKGKKRDRCRVTYRRAGLHGAMPTLGKEKKRRRGKIRKKLSCPLPCGLPLRPPTLPPFPPPFYQVRLSYVSVQARIRDPFFFRSSVDAWCETRADPLMVDLFLLFCWTGSASQYIFGRLGKITAGRAGRK